MKRSCLLLVALSVFTSSVVCMAQSEQSVDFRSAGGAFPVHFVPGTWMQRSVLINNSSDAFHRVKASALSNLPGRGETAFSTVLNVPPRSSRTVDISMIAGTPRDTMVSKGQTVRHHEQAFVAYDAESGERLGRSFGMSTMLSPDDLTVALVRHVSLDDDAAYLLGKMDKGKVIQASPLGDDVRGLSTSLHSLPTVWQGYSMIKLLVLMEADIHLLMPSQRQAIMNWVRRGGVLIISSPRTMHNIADTEISRFAGVISVGAHYTTRLGVKGISQTRQITLDFDEPVPMAQLMPTTATVLATSDSMPLVVRQRRGQGTVFSLATSVRALGDSRLEGFWAQVSHAILQRTAIRTEDFVHDDPEEETSASIAVLEHRMSSFDDSSRPQAQRLLDEMKAFMAPGKSALNSIAGRAGPGRIVPVSIMLALAIVVGLVGLLLRLRRRGELLWLVLIPVAIAGGLAFHTYGRLSSDEPRLSFVGVVSGLDDDHARVQEIYQYYSGPDAHSVDFESGLTGTIRPIGAAGSSMLSLSEVFSFGKVMLKDVKLNPNDTTGAYVDAVIEGRSVRPTVSFDATGVRGNVNNMMGFDLSDAIIYANRMTYRVGVLPKGSTDIAIGRNDLLGAVELKNLNEQVSLLDNRRKSVHAPGKMPRSTPSKNRRGQLMITTSGDFTGSLMRDYIDPIKSRLISSMVAIPQRFARVTLNNQGRDDVVDPRPVLIAYANRNLADPMPENAAPRQGWTAIIWPIEIVAPDPGQAVSIPPGFTHVVINASSFYNPITETWGPIISNSGLRMTAWPPDGIELKDVVVNLRIHINARSYRMKVMGLTQAQQNQPATSKNIKGVQVADFERPDGVINVSVGDADRFATPDGGYAIFIRMERIDPGEESIDNMIKSIEVDLGGTSR